MFSQWQYLLKESKSEMAHERLAIKHDFKRLCLPALLNWKLVIKKFIYFISNKKIY